MTPYANDQTRLLDRYAQLADEHAARAQKWLTNLAAAEAEAVAAEEAFISDFSPDNARRLASAKNSVRDFMHAAIALESAGGPSEARVRSLRTPAVFAAFVKGFSERLATLEKLVPPALKALASRRAFLTEAGLASGHIEADQHVGALRLYHDAIVRGIATATFGREYAARRGEGYALKPFESLYSDLVVALPQAPATPSS